MNGLIRLPHGWGTARLARVAVRRTRRLPGTRSYDHSGHRLSWKPPASLDACAAACDLEGEGRDVSFMAARFGLGPDGFRSAWAATEVLAKLANVPILVWLRDHGVFTATPGRPMRVSIPSALPSAGARLLVLSRAGCVMAFGFTR